MFTAARSVARNRAPRTGPRACRHQRPLRGATRKPASQWTPVGLRQARDRACAPSPQRRRPPRLPARSVGARRSDRSTSGVFGTYGKSTRRCGGLSKSAFGADNGDSREQLQMHLARSHHTRRWISQRGPQQRLVELVHGIAIRSIGSVPRGRWTHDRRAGHHAERGNALSSNSRATNASVNAAKSHQARTETGMNPGTGAVFNSPAV